MVGRVPIVRGAGRPGGGHASPCVALPRNAPVRNEPPKRRDHMVEYPLVQGPKPGANHQQRNMVGVHVVIWSTATVTEAMRQENMPAGDQGAPGTRFIQQAVDALAALHEHRAKRREEVLKQATKSTCTLRQIMKGALEDRSGQRRGKMWGRTMESRRAVEV